jgi:hypothetical protein
MKHHRANHVSHLRSAHCKVHLSPARPPGLGNPTKPSDGVTSRMGACLNRELPHAVAAGRGADQAVSPAPDSGGIEVVVRFRGRWS